MTKNNKNILTKVSIKENGILAETVYNKSKKSISFIVNDYKSKIKKQDSIELSNMIYKPLPINNGLLEKSVLTLPSKIEDYNNKEELVKEIKNFIHRYVDISESFETVSSYYVLMSWVYDKFDNVPYLRVRGNPGNGKSRFLNIMSALCYKSTFFKAGTTDSMLFRTLDLTEGTLIIDEADFRYSDKTSVLTKVLNNGFEKGSTVSRLRPTKDGGYEPEFFNVFSPKIFANRNIFKDDALESRCITEYMGKSSVRQEVLVKLDSEFESKAESIRNKLLKYRLYNLEKINPLNSNEITFDISLRGKQISTTLATLMDGKDLNHLEKVMLDIDRNIQSIRSNLVEVDVIRILSKELKQKRLTISVKEIAEKLSFESKDWTSITPRKVGSILENLHIKRKRGGENGNFMVYIKENKYQINLMSKYYNC